MAVSGAGFFGNKGCEARYVSESPPDDAQHMSGFNEWVLLPRAASNGDVWHRLVWMDGYPMRLLAFSPLAQWDKRLKRHNDRKQADLESRMFGETL